jgi:hypothetical protein
MVYCGGTTEFLSHCVLLNSFTPSVPALTGGTLITKLLRGKDDVDNDEAEEDDEPEAEEDDAVNTSYEEIEDEASPKLVNFKDGEKIQFSMYFRNSQFSA